MPLTKEEFAKGARVVYVNTPECRQMMEMLIETDKTWKRLNRSFIRGRIGLEEMQRLHLQFEKVVRELKTHLKETKTIPREKRDRSKFAD